MLTEERFAKILSILERMGSVTVQQLMTELDASESTVRRDLNTLDANGQLVKVHGGAILKNTVPSMMKWFTARSRTGRQRIRSHAMRQD